MVYLPLSTNLLAGHLLLLTFAFALRWPSSYVVLAYSNSDPAVSGKVFKKVLPRMWSIAHPFSKCNTNKEECNCSVCSYLDKYFSYYITFTYYIYYSIGLPTLEHSHVIMLNIIVCNKLHGILIKQLCRALGLCTLYSIVVYNEP